MACPSAEPHHRSLYAWACAIEQRIESEEAPSDCELLFELCAARFGGNVHGLMSLARTAARRSGDDVLLELARQDFLASGACEKWLGTEGGERQLKRLADEKRFTLQLSHLVAEPSQRKSPAANGPWRVERHIATDVIVGAFFFCGGDRVRTAEMLNEGIPSGLGAGIRPDIVRNALTTFRTARLVSLPTEAIPLVVEDVAVRFAANRLLWRCSARERGHSPWLHFSQKWAAGLAEERRRIIADAYGGSAVEQLWERVHVATLRMRILYLEGLQRRRKKAAANRAA